MRVAVIANDLQKEELLAQGLRDAVEVDWLQEVIPVQGAECYIDLLFIPTANRIELLRKLQPAVIIINDVITTLNKLPLNFVRINAWPGFLKRTIAEAACADTKTKLLATTIFSYFNKTTEWVPDTAGLISARVLAMIINEAWFTLEEGVSTKEEIDIAMKLGTNYPYGPFEWGDKIGSKNVYALLLALSQTNSRYEPAALLKKEVLQ
jgi:3-hydroxybutyryl-CoA dehydrogenase